MTDGSDNSAGVEPANPGSSSDSGSGWCRRAALLQAAEATLYAIGEQKAAREVGDALTRLTSRAAREGERSGEGLHGQDSAQEKVKVHTMLCATNDATPGVCDCMPP